MDPKLETLTIFLVLLPGFVASTIFDLIVTRRSKDAFGKVIEALEFSFVIYAILVVLLRIPTISMPSDVKKLPETLAAAVHLNFVIGASLLSVLLPLAIGSLVNSNRHMKFLRWLGITHKTSRDTIWLDVFVEQKRYVIVNLSGKRRIFGWPMYYSEEPAERLLYLQDPAWVNEDGTYTDLNVHGILLAEPNSIESIEFTKVDEVSAQPGRSEEHDQGSATD